MAKAKVASPRAGRQRIPLKDVTITWQRDPHFIGEKGPQSVTLTGEQLAPLLGWLTALAPGNVDGYFGADMTWRLPSLSKAIQCATEGSDPEQALDACHALGECLEDLAARIAAYEKRAKIAEAALVTLSAPAPKAVA